MPGPYTLLSVAAIVLGGVSLAGGRGGVFGPIVAVVILQLIQTDLTFLQVDSNMTLVAQGAILIGVVMIGSVIELRRRARMSAADRRPPAVEPRRGPARCSAIAPSSR